MPNEGESFIKKLSNIEKNLVHSFDTKNVKLIQLSSAKVKLNKKNSFISDNDLVYTKAKLASEKIIKNNFKKYIILRPPLIYGPNVKANFLSLMKLVEKGIPLTFKNLENSRSYLYLENLVDCKDILVWGRSETSLMKYKSIMSENGYNVEITQNQEDIAKNCNLIIMTTPSKEPLLQSINKNKGIHITAIGSDTHDKQELNTSIFKDADIVATDSLEQCKHRGEIPHAVRDKFLDYKTIIELGAIIKTGNKYRNNEDQITIADLTGMAVQDIQIAKAVCQTLKK